MNPRTYPLTEGLRAGLDAAGIGWEQPRVFGHGITVYRAGGIRWTVIECEVFRADGTMRHALRAKTEPLRTPKQALAATVGVTAARHADAPERPISEVGA